MKRPVLGAALVLVLAGALAGAGGITYLRPASPSAAGPVVAIMPLGDSITAGWPDMRYGGYRHRLAALLATEGYRVRFVGSRRNGDGIPAGAANEGHLGWTIPELKAGIDSHRWLETYRPDIILLHIGTNDLNGGSTAPAAANLSLLVEDILARAPAAHLIVAAIVPFQTGPDKGYRAYLAAIPKIVERAGSRVSMADMETILTAADYADKLHPSTRGYDKMAQAWETAIRPVLAALR
jgi:lysophospholipase L1-like esterase